MNQAKSCFCEWEFQRTVSKKPPFCRGWSKFAPKSLQRRIITNAEKSNSGSRQIPAEFGIIPVHCFWCIVIERNNFVFDKLPLPWLENTFLACLPGIGECGNNNSQPNWRLWLATLADIGNSTESTILKNSPKSDPGEKRRTSAQIYLRGMSTLSGHSAHSATLPGNPASHAALCSNRSVSHRFGENIFCWTKKCK